MSETAISSPGFTQRPTGAEVSRLKVTIFLLCGLSGNLDTAIAQGSNGVSRRPAVSADSVPYSVAEAEAYLRRYTAATHGAGTRPMECVEIGDRDEVAIGDFVAGRFRDYRWLWLQGGSKMRWSLAKVDRGAPPTLTLRARQIGDQSEAVVFTTSTAASGAPSGMGSVMYAGGFRLPSRGTWLLVATAGEFGGCAVYVL